MSMLYQKKLAGFIYRTYASTEDGFFQSPEGQRCYRVKQTHSKDLVKLTPPLGSSSDRERMARQEADGLVVAASFPTPTPLLQIATADCLPIAIIGKNGYAHVHAGWRGLQQNILDQKELRDLDPHLFFIGPAIHACCYEVGPDFADHFREFAHHPFWPQSFFRKNGKYFFDLIHFASSQVRFLHPQAGVMSSGVCTACEQKFASFRRDQTKERNQNILVPL